MGCLRFDNSSWEFYSLVIIDKRTYETPSEFAIIQSAPIDMTSNTYVVIEQKETSQNMPPILRENFRKRFFSNEDSK